MLQEAIQEVAQLAKTAAQYEAEPSFHANPHDPTKYVFAFGNQVETRDVPPPLRAHKVRRLEDLVDLALRAPDPSIWHSESGIVLIWNDVDRRDKVSMPLPYTDAWSTVLEKLPAAKFTQKDFVRLLRTTLKGVISNGDELLAAAREIKFAQNDAGHATVAHGSESLGRSILKEITGAKTFPEECLLEVVIYRDFESRVVVPAIVEISVEDQRFALVPAKDDLQRALDVVQNRIHEKIEEQINTALAEDPEKLIPVYYGTP